MKYKVIIPNKNAAGGAADNVRAGTSVSFYTKNAAIAFCVAWVEASGTCWLWDGASLTLYT